MIQKYLDYIKFIRSYSDATVLMYKKWLKKFESYLQIIWKTTENPEEIKLVDVLEFIEYLRRKWLAASSCNAEIDAVRGFLKYCKDVLELNVLYHRKILYCKEPERPMEFFDKKEKNLILNAVNEWVGKREITQLRNKLIVYMLLNTWLRCHELAKIKVSEIWESLQIVGKGSKLRTIYLKKELLDMIEEYLSERKNKSEYLFDSAKDWHMREWSIRKTFAKLTKNLWFRIHAHKFRHTFATDLLNIPWSNIFSVAKLMGHSRITTTQMYLWVNNTELKNLQFRLKY